MLPDDIYKICIRLGPTFQIEEHGKTSSMHNDVQAHLSYVHRKGQISPCLTSKYRPQEYTILSPFPYVLLESRFIIGGRDKLGYLGTLVTKCCKFDNFSLPFRTFEHVDFINQAISKNPCCKKSMS